MNPQDNEMFFPTAFSNGFARESLPFMYSPGTNYGLEASGDVLCESEISPASDSKVPARHTPRVKGKKVARASKAKCKGKRPLSAYNLFFRDQRRGGNKTPCTTKTVSELWKALGATGRAYYDSLAAEEKLRQYNKGQQWIAYAVSPSAGDEMPLTHFSGETATEQTDRDASPDPIREDGVPWPKESIKEIARNLDAASIDFIIRTFA